MEAKTLTPDADAEADAAAAEPLTLAAGELVWVKPSKPRRHCWWPARMLAACPASAVRDAQVSYFVDPADDSSAPSAPPARVRRFADDDADLMAGGSIARGFLGAVEVAHARAVAALRAQLTCACVPPPLPGEDCSVTGVANLAPAEFLAALREAALGVSYVSVGLVDRARLKCWARAFGEGWGPHGAQHYPRRLPDDLVDKIDLDVPAGEDRDADDWLAEDQHKALVRPEETPKQKKRKRSASKVMDKRDEEEEGKIDSAEHVTSGKRKRKKSKYLSPPYTNLGVVDKSTRKLVDLPKALVPKAAQVSRNVSPLPSSVVVEDVLLLVRRLGEVPKHTDDFPKDAEEFLCLFRSMTFIDGADYKSCKAHESPLMRGSRSMTFIDSADYKSCKAHESPLTRGSRNVGMDIAGGLVFDSHAVLKQGSCLSKRGRKKDEAGSGVGSSIKRKKQEKISPAATIGAGIPITAAIPIRQVKAEDMRTLMKAGSDARGIGVGIQNEKGKPSPLKVPISAVDPEAAESGHEHAQASILVLGNMLPEQSGKENDAANLEATRSEMNVQNFTVDVPTRSVQTEAMELQANDPIEAQSVVVDVPVGIVSKEATEPEMCVRKDKNVQSDVSDVPDRIVSKEPTELETDNNHINENVQRVAADVSDRSVSKEATMPDADIHIHENLQNAADLLVSSGLSPMHEDMSQLVDGNNEPGGVEVCTVQESYASLQAMVPEVLSKVNTNGADTIGVNDTLKDEFQKDGQPVKKVELPAGTNGTWLDPASLTPKKKKKKSAQHFSNPAAVIVEFERGAIVPSRQVLLSTFGKYGYLIESQTDISETTRSACVVFGKSIEAEEAYKNGCQYLLGQFGPPFAKLRLDYSPIKLAVPSPSLASKPPLRDIRKNLEDMISARRSALNKATSSDGQLNPVPDKLLGEMQGLLAKVDRMLTRPPANAS